jgi:hypothetical protein
MCIKRRSPSPEPLPPPPPYFHAMATPVPEFTRHPHFPRRTISDPMYMVPFYYPWPPNNPPWPHLPPLPSPAEHNVPLPTPIMERTTRRPNLFSLQEFLHEEEQDQQTHDPHRTLRPSHPTTL